MIRMMVALVVAGTAALERIAARLSEDAKSYPRREFYRGYGEGLEDGLAEAEHAKRWLAERGGRRQAFPNE